MNNDNTLVLIDGHALAYRMFYAISANNFFTKEGEPTNATFGFTRHLLDWLTHPTPPHYLAVMFDVGKTFRDELYSAYKGTRAPMPDDLVVQIERIRQVVKALNIPVFEMDGYEADDLIGTVAQQATAQGVDVHIVTGDRDLLQLVRAGVVVELPGGREKSAPRLYDDQAIFDEYGLKPRQVVDWKALEGDASDNIPGVPGIGRVTAVKLLQKYETLDNIYQHLDELNPKTAAKLREFREQAYLGRTLATIITDIPIPFDLQAALLHDVTFDDALTLFSQLQFRTFSKLLLDFRAKSANENEIDQSPTPEPATPTTVPTHAVTVRTPQQLAELVSVLEQAQWIAFDTETTGLDRFSAEIVGISLATNSPTAYYIPVGHLAQPAQSTAGQMSLFATSPTRVSNQLTLDEVLTALRPILTNPQLPKVAHNAKFDMAMLQEAGVQVEGVQFDTMLAEWLCDPSSRMLGLKELARHRLGITMTEISALIGKGKQQINFGEVPLETAAEYAAADADMTLRLHQPLAQELEDKSLLPILELEMALIPVLVEMERVGIALDQPFFSRYSAEITQRLNELEEAVYLIVGKRFNLNSTQQLSDALFITLELPHKGLKKTASGHFSTAAGVLDDLLDVDERGIIKLIIEHRELSKLKSTYADALPSLINPRTGRVHTTFNQTGAATGRLSSNSPNLQNIPIRTQLGRKLRAGFVPPTGWQFIAADYSQVELRILAHVSGDETLVRAFHEDQDIHKTTAASVYSVPLESVTFEQRRFAKAVNFGLMYGMGPYRLARDSELTLAEAENYIKAYFERFPGVRRYLDETKEKARAQGYVETLFGRRQYYPILQREGGANPGDVAAAERAAINHPIQGTAADIIKRAMITLHQQLQAKRLQARLLLQIHDELILEAPQEEIEEVRSLLITTMSNACQLIVPLKVESNVGDNWYELK